MNISQLDKIDNEERYQEIRDELDEFDNQSDGSDGDRHCLDVDLSYNETARSSKIDTSACKDDESRNVRDSVGITDSSQLKPQKMTEEQESYADIQELEKLKQLTNLNRSEDDSSDVIHRLVQSLHQRNTEYRALELQFNHVKLQNESLLHQERKLREAVNSMEFDLAVSEENVTLLEEQLKNIASFEDGHVAGSSNASSGGDSKANRSHTLEKLRGNLLNASHRQIYDLEQELRQLRRLYDNDTRQYSEKILQVQSQNQALKEEAQSLGERLAQRTVLYSAQERRYLTHQRISSMDMEGKVDELTRTSAKLQQLEGQCAQLDRERVQLLMQKKEYEETIRIHRDTQERESARILELEEELTEVLDANRSLQDTISLLRGSDLEELERGMAQEVEGIRAEAKAVEDGLQRDLADARDLLRTENEKIDLLRNENEQHRNRIREVTDLLREVWGHSTLNTGGDQTQSGQSKQSVTSKHESNSIMYDLLYSDHNLPQSRRSHSQPVPEHLMGDHQEVSTLGQESVRQHLLHPNPMSSFISESSVGSVSQLSGAIRSHVPPDKDQNMALHQNSDGNENGEEELFSVASIFWKMKVKGSEGGAGSVNSAPTSDIRSGTVPYTHEAHSNQMLSSIESSDSFHMRLDHSVSQETFSFEKALLEGGSVCKRKCASSRYNDGESAHSDNEENHDQSHALVEGDTPSPDRIIDHLTSIDMSYITILSVLLQDLIHSILHAYRHSDSTEKPFMGESADTLGSKRQPVVPLLLQKGITRFILGIKAPLPSAIDRDSEDSDVLKEFDSLPLTHDEMNSVQELIAAVGIFMESVPESIIQEAEARFKGDIAQTKAACETDIGTTVDTVTAHLELVHRGTGDNCVNYCQSTATEVGTKTDEVLVSEQMTNGTDCSDLIPMVNMEVNTINITAEAVEIGTDTFDLKTMSFVEVGTQVDEVVVSEQQTIGTDCSDLFSRVNVEVNTTDITVEVSEIGIDTSDLDHVTVVEVGTETDEIAETEQFTVGTDCSDLISTVNTEMSTDDVIIECVEIGTDTFDLEIVTVAEAGTETDEVDVPEHLTIGTDCDDLISVSNVSAKNSLHNEVEVVENGTDTSDLQTVSIVEVGTQVEEVVVPEQQTIGTDCSDLTAAFNFEISSKEGMVEVSEIGIDTSDLDNVTVVEVGTETDEIAETEQFTVGTDCSDLISTVNTEMSTDDVIIECVEIGTDTFDLEIMTVAEAGTETDEVDVPEHLTIGTDCEDLETIANMHSDQEKGCSTVVDINDRSDHHEDVVTYDDSKPMRVPSMESDDYSDCISHSTADSGVYPEAVKCSFSADVNAKERVLLDDEKAALRNQIDELRDEFSKSSVIWQQTMAAVIEDVKVRVHDEHVHTIAEVELKFNSALDSIKEKSTRIAELEESLSSAMELTHHMAGELENAKEIIDTEKRLKDESIYQLKSLSTQAQQKITKFEKQLEEKDQAMESLEQDIENMRCQYDNIFSKLRMEVSLKEKDKASTRDQHNADVEKLMNEIQTLKSNCNPDDSNSTLSHQIFELNKWKIKFYDNTEEEERASVFEMVVDIYNQKIQLESGFSKLFEEKIKLESELSERNESIKVMKADVADYVERMQEKWRESKHALKLKYKHKVDKMQVQHDEEMKQLVDGVKAECADIYAEVKRAEDDYKLQTEKMKEQYEAKLQQKEMSDKLNHSDRTNTRVSFTSSTRHSGNSSKRHSFTPEMLSPEETQDLVRSILSRSAVTSISVLETSTQQHFSSESKHHSPHLTSTHDEKPPLSPSRSHDSSSKKVRNSINLETRDMILHALQGGSLSDLDISRDSILGDELGEHNKSFDKLDARDTSIPISGINKATPPRHPPPPSSPPKSAVLSPAITSESPDIHQRGISTRIQNRKPHEGLATAMDRAVIPTMDNENTFQKASSRIISNTLENMLSNY